MTSSYDSALIDTAMIEDPRLVVLPRGVRLLHIEALVWSKLHRTDGRLPTAALGRMTDEPNPREAAARLAAADIWRSVGDDWEIVGFTNTQMSAARVAANQAASRDRYDRWTTKSKRVGNGVGNDVSNGAASGSAGPPAPPARLGKGQKGGGAASPQTKLPNEIPTFEEQAAILVRMHQRGDEPRIYEYPPEVVDLYLRRITGGS